MYNCVYVMYVCTVVYAVFIIIMILLHSFPYKYLLTWYDIGCYAIRYATYVWKEEDDNNMPRSVKLYYRKE